MKIVKATILFMFLIFYGCSIVPLGLTPSTGPLISDGVKKYKILGKSSGSQSYFTLMGILSFGEPDLKEAINDARLRLNGDDLINVTYWVKSEFYLIGTMSIIEVEGTVIKYQNKKEN